MLAGDHGRDHQIWEREEEYQNFGVRKGKNFENTVEGGEVRRVFPKGGVSGRDAEDARGAS